MTTPPRAAVLTALQLTLPGAARSEINWPNILTNEGQTLVAVGALIVAGGIAALAVHLHHRHTASEVIAGCVQTVDGTSMLIDEKDEGRYTLVGNVPANGGRMKLRGTIVTANEGIAAFRVDRISHNYGVCSAEGANGGTAGR